MTEEQKLRVKANSRRHYEKYKKPFHDRYERQLIKLQRELLALSLFDLAYIAGILDGEGYIGIRQFSLIGGRKRSYYQCGIGITNTSLVLFEWLQSKIPSGTLHWRKGIKHLNQKGSEVLPVGYWQLQGRPAAELLKQIARFMVIKREKAELLIEFYANGLSNGALLDNAELARRAAIFEKARAIKYRAS